MAAQDVVIIPHNNGPYEVRGSIRIETEGGRVIQTEGPETWLCRCGQSASKPFCDGEHAKVGFQSDLDAPAVSGSFHDVCGDSDVLEGCLLGVRVEGKPVVIGRVDGRLYAIGGTCTHQMALLEDGELEGKEVACPLHGATYDITTGAVLSPPATEAVARYEVRVDQGRVLVSSTSVSA